MRGGGSVSGWRKQGESSWDDSVWDSCACGVWFAAALIHDPLMYLSKPLSCRFLFHEEFMRRVTILSRSK